MVECFRCGITGDKVRLFDAISDNGIVKICEKCAYEEDIPIIKKTSDFFLKSYETRKSEDSLKKIINKSISINEKKEFLDLIDNFHWIIMRARRLKHLTAEQLGKELGESEKTIKLAEKGFLPTNYQSFIRKIEEKLSIRIFKEEARENMRNQTRKLGFDPLTTKSLTISDLQKMKRKKEDEILAYEIAFNKESIEKENEPEFIRKNKENLLDEDIDKIIFRK